MSEKNKKQRSLSLKSQVADFLIELDDEFNFFLAGIQKPSFVLKYGHDYKEIRDSKKRIQRQKCINEIKRQQLVEEIVIADQLHLTLTDKGARQLFRLKVMQSGLLPKGKVCMVIFDIPEEHAAVRKQLRDFLKEAGFLMIQRSVWISPFDAAVLLVELFKMKNTKQWVRIFEAIELK